MADSMFFSNFAVMKKIIITIITTLLTLSTHAQFVQCEDTCQHVHGIDLSHYQGNVFWETVGDNTKMAYVYLKATEGGTNVDSKYSMRYMTYAPIETISNFTHKVFHSLSEIEE